MKGGLRVALLSSILLHLLALNAPGWHFADLISDDEAPPIKAVLLPPPRSAAKPAPRPRVIKPKVAKAKPTESQALVTGTPPQTIPLSTPELLSPTQAAPPDVLAESEIVAPEGLSSTAPNPATAASVTEAEATSLVVLPEVVPPLPRSGRIEYAVTRGVDGLVVGRTTHVWQHDGKRYTISATIRTTGIAALFKTINMVQTSEGGFRQGELKPDHFRFDRGENKIESASFDWQGKQVSLGNGQVVAIGDGAEDLLSMFYQLMHTAQKGEGFIMAVATGRKVERYAFEWLPEEELSLKAGRFRAWHVRVRAVDGGKDITEVWLAQDAAGLPVKIRFTDRKGDIAEQVAEAIDFERPDYERPSP